MRLRRLDPRSKLVVVLALSSLAVFLQNIWLLSGVLALGSVLTGCLGGNFGFMRKFRRLLWLFVGIALIQSIFAPSGVPLFAPGGFPLVTTGGLHKGIMFLLRIMAIMIPATIMASSTTREIIQALVQWRVPYEIAFMVSLAVRFLPLLGEEVRDTFVAIQLRGIELEKIPLGKRLRMYSYLLLPVLSGVILKAREISTALETRAFRAYPERTSYLQLQLQKVDYLVMILSGFFVLAVLVLNSMV